MPTLTSDHTFEYCLAESVNLFFRTLDLAGLGVNGFIAWVRMRAAQTRFNSLTLARYVTRDTFEVIGNVTIQTLSYLDCAFLFTANYPKLSRQRHDAKRLGS